MTSRRRRDVRGRLLAAIGAGAIAAGALAACGEETAPAVIQHSVPWELRSVDGSRLGLRYRAGSCAGEPFSARPRVDEGPERVVIAVIARRPAVARCAGLVRIGDLEVTLRAPLSDRSLVHAAVDAGESPAVADGAASRCPADAPAGGEGARPGGASGRLDARRLIGMTVGAARDLAADFGCTVRVIERNGRPLAHTQDRRRDRINVAVADARVVRVSIG